MRFDDEYDKKTAWLKLSKMKLTIWYMFSLQSPQTKTTTSYIMIMTAAGRSNSFVTNRINIMLTGKKAAGFVKSNDCT